MNALMEFKKRHHLTYPQLGHLLSISARVAEAYCRGTRETPGPVAKLAELLGADSQIERWVEEAKGAVPRRKTGRKAA